MKTPGSCAGVAWAAVGSWSGLPAPLAVTGLRPGYCYRWRAAVTGSGPSAAATSGSVLVAPTPTGVFTYPPTDQTVTSPGTTNAISWTTSGAVYGITIQQQYGRATHGGQSCANVTWSTAWSVSGVTSPFTISGFQRGYCYRYALFLESAAGAWPAYGSGALDIHP
ncbi:MAG TPA: hypothetical protein VEY67_01015 [Candidatus Dormibacteraeota bacterium]|nr:hypothetical protein [Candidatus Dormibacteraeota bacterium]